MQPTSLRLSNPAEASEKCKEKRQHGAGAYQIKKLYFQLYYARMRKEISSGLKQKSV